MSAKELSVPESLLEEEEAENVGVNLWKNNMVGFRGEKKG